MESITIEKGSTDYSHVVMEILLLNLQYQLLLR